MKIIDQLDLAKENFEGYLLANSDENKIELSNLNICIGENNSGKSRFIRSIFHIDSFTINYNDIEAKLNKLIKDKNEFIALLQNKTGTTITDTFLKSINITINTKKIYSNDNINKIIGEINRIRSAFGTINMMPTKNKTEIEPKITEILDQASSLINYLKDIQSSPRQIKIIYLHTLRTLFQLSFNARNELYKSTVHDDIFATSILNNYTSEKKRQCQCSYYYWTRFLFQIQRFVP